MFLVTQKLKKYLPILPLILINFAFGVDEEHLEKELSNINVKTTRGENINLNKIKTPVIVLNFWASWCTPCVAEFKDLNNFIKTLGEKNVFVLGINNDEEKAKKKLQKFEKKYNLKFSSVLDDKVGFTDKFMVSKIPTSIIFINRKFYKFIPEKFNFMDSKFIKEIKNKAKIRD